MGKIVIFLCLLLVGVESALDQRYPFGYPLSSVDGTITCHCDDDHLGSSKRNPKTFRLPRDTESAWKILNGAMDYNVCGQQYSSEICNYIRSCGSCYADIKRCYLNGIGTPNCVEKNDVLVMKNPNAPERYKTVKKFIPRPDKYESVKKRSVSKMEESNATFGFKEFPSTNTQRNCHLPSADFNGEVVYCLTIDGRSECEMHCKPGFEFPEGASRKITCDERDGNNVWKPNGFERCVETHLSTKGKPDASERNGAMKLRTSLVK